METKRIFDDRMQNILQSLSQCKKDYLQGKEECKILREVNTRLEVELKEARELEKSHRYHLLSSREMIGNLQESLSQLVYLKRDMKKLTEDLLNKDSSIAVLQKEKENILIKCDSALKELQKAHERQTEELADAHARSMQQVQHEADTQIAQFSCDIEELRVKIKEMESEYTDKMSVVVLEYEEKLQRSAAQITQLHDQIDQHAGLVARTDASIDAYRRRLEELEEKLKQNQFKNYLAQSTLPSQYESQVERPYSVNRDYVAPVDLDPVLETPKPKHTQTNTNTQNKPGRPNKLQVIYYGNKNTNVPKIEKKGPFNIAKKRKLYNEKDFQDF